MIFLGAWRGTQLSIGLFLYGFALAMMIRATLGVAPWDVLSQGSSLQTGVPFGVMTNLIGVVVLLLWIPLRQRPGIGTVLNVLLVGPSAEVGLAVLGEPEALWARILLFSGGLLLLAVASGLYIGARLGPGPRDGLMTGLHQHFGLPIWFVRTAIEGTDIEIASTATSDSANLVVLETATTVPPEAWVRLTVAPAVPSAAGPETPRRERCAGGLDKSRRTRVVHELLNCAITPFASSNVA